MGFEFHSRRRNSRGQFDHMYHSAQIHVYCSKKEWRTIRVGALVAAEDLSEFCREAALQRAREIIQSSKLTENGLNSIIGTDSINGAT